MVCSLDIIPPFDKITLDLSILLILMILSHQRAQFCHNCRRHNDLAIEFLQQRQMTGAVQVDQGGRIDYDNALTRF